MSQEILLSASTRGEIKRKIDEVVDAGQPFETIRLILPAIGNARCRHYRGMSIRVWYRNGQWRYDAAYLPK